MCVDTCGFASLPRHAAKRIVMAADRNVMAASRFLAAAAVSSVDHAPVRAVIGRAMAVEEKKAMAVMPNELTKAGKLDSSKRVVGRIVEVEEKDANYTCYLVCGTHRKDTLQIDAWQEHKGPARRELTANRLVHHQRTAGSPERRETKV